MEECYVIEVEPSYPGWRVQVELFINGERQTVLGERQWYVTWTTFGGRRWALRKGRAVVADDQYWREHGKIEKNPERKVRICRKDKGEWAES